MKKKILIIGLAHSTHTHAWLDLIDHKKFEVRLFGEKNTPPGALMKVFHYSFSNNFPFVNLKDRQNGFARAIGKIIYLLDYKSGFLKKLWLTNIIKVWQPDIVHTLGLDPAAFNFLPIHESLKKKSYRWIVTIRGGSDIEFERFIPAKKEIFKRIFSQCDSAIADNPMTYQYAYQLGLVKTKKPPLAFIPGTGGMDLAYLAKLRKIKTTASRTILWTKACEVTYSKGLPVLEALKTAWPKIQPCRVVMSRVNTDFMPWINALPLEMRQSLEIHEYIPRKELLKTMAQSRVVLLPSLVDGIPNSLYEAMATKTCAIVSPLATIRTAISDENVLFARNLYPDEIAKQIIKAMNDDILVDRMIKNNLRLVNDIANRKKIGPQVNLYYQEMAYDSKKTDSNL